MTRQTQTTLERAFEIAQSGTCRTVTEIRLKLRGEGFDIDQITGPLLLKQLNRILSGRDHADEGSEKSPST